MNTNVYGYVDAFNLYCRCLKRITVYRWIGFTILLFTPLDSRSVSAGSTSCFQLAYAKTVPQVSTSDTLHIFAVDADGTHERQITFGDDYQDVYPSWSPDGQRILFLRARFLQGERFHVFVVNADGTGLKRLTDGNMFDAYPRWSPDGKKIAFIAGKKNDTHAAIYTMNADDSNRAHINDINFAIKAVDTGIDIYAHNVLTFAADSKHIFYAWQGLQRIDLDSKTAHTIPVTGQDFEVALDGKQFVYVGGTHGGETEIYTMAADGKNARQLTDSGEDLYPSWSPDGKRIAFTSNRVGTSDFLTYDIYVMAADGSNIQRLTTDMMDYWNPQWSPDGKMLSFWSNITQQTYIIGADGKNFHPITHLDNNEAAGDFAWSPDLCR